MRSVLFYALVVAASGCSDSTPSMMEIDLHSEIELNELELEATSRSLIELVSHLAQQQSSRAPVEFYHHVENRDPKKVAKRYRNHGLVIRDNPKLFPQPPVNWGANPNNDKNWMFQKNALYVVAPFIQAYRQTGEAQYLDVARLMINDWIDFNLVRNEANEYKWDDMSTGLRAVLIAYVLQSDLRSSDLDADSIAKLLRAGILHLEILTDPAKLAAGNHAYFQFAGIQALCLVLQELSRCERDTRYQQKHFDERVLAQFTEQGINREHSPAYHYYSWNRLTKLLATNWFEPSGEALRRIKLAGEVNKWFRHPNSDVVAIGDSERTSWSPARDDRGSDLEGNLGNFPESGYAVLRNDWHDRPIDERSYLIFWAGDEQPTGLEGRPFGHSHADNFTFEWSSRGVPIIVDSGKYSYDLDDFRDYFQSTRAHNTIEIDGQDYRNRTPKGLAPGILSASANDTQHVYAALHYDDVNHSRLLVHQPNEWLVIIDRLHAQTTRHYTQWLHFHESWKVHKRSTVYNVRNGQHQLFLASLGTPVREEHSRGVTTPRIQGWVSPKYREKLPNDVIGLSKTGTDATFVTLISFDEFDLAPAMYEVDEQAISVSWVTAEGDQGFVFNIASGIVHST